MIGTAFLPEKIGSYCLPAQHVASYDSAREFGIQVAVEKMHGHTFYRITMVACLIIIATYFSSFSKTNMLQSLINNDQDGPISFYSNNDDNNELLPITEVIPEPASAPEPEKDLPNYAYLGQFLKPWENIKGDKNITFNFENSELTNLIKYFEKEYNVTFILDSIVQPMEGGKNPAGTKFSFKSKVPFNKKQAWTLFTTFLEMAGFKIIPGPIDNVYQITTNDPQSRFSTAKDPIPTFIGIDPNLLPEGDFVRYVYFIQNATPNAILKVSDTLKSSAALRPILVDELNALILADDAGNIRSTLTVLNELDKPTLPESLTIIKLKKADALKVKDLYTQLVSEEKTSLQRSNRKPSNLSLFTENVRVHADARTNSLIILGPRKNVQRIEDFVRREIDKDIDLPYSPLHVYQLKFIDAEATAQILTEVKNAQSPSAFATTPVGQVLGGTKNLSPNVTITAEKSTNTLIINAEYDDYLQLYNLIQKIDMEQPQIAIRALVLDVDTIDSKAFGVQFRNKFISRKETSNAEGINFQTSGLPLSPTNFAPLVVRRVNPEMPDDDINGLLGNLLRLAGRNTAGSTVITLGNDIFGIWGIFKALQTVTDTTVVTKPFIVTTNNYNAQISIEEIRLVAGASIHGASITQNSFGDVAAGLTLNIIPQISPTGLLQLSVSIDDSTFTTQVNNGASPSQGNRSDKRVTTSVVIQNNQVLAVGGLARNTITEIEVKVPVLGDIPLLGWMFRNKSLIYEKNDILVLISAEVLNPRDRKTTETFTQMQMCRTQDILDRIRADEQLADPITRWFFEIDKRPLDCHDLKFAQPYDTPPVRMPDEVIIEESNVMKTRRARQAARKKLRAQASTPINPDIGEIAASKRFRATVSITPVSNNDEITSNTPPAIPEKQLAPYLAAVASTATMPALNPRLKIKKLEEFVKEQPLGVST